MKILVTNDDGVHSPALGYLRDELSKFGKVEIVAPEKEASASSHAITVHRPLRFYECTLVDGKNGWAVSGTPADCVVLGFLKFGKPDLVIAGINPGPNLGDDVTYSGTIGAAFEAALHGVNSIAISVTDFENPDFRQAAKITAKLIEKSRILQQPFFLNVNIPPTNNGKIKVTKLGKRLWSNNVQQRIDPRNKPYYWISGYPDEVFDEESDIYAVREGFISITPIRLELTDYQKIEDLRNYFEIPKDL
ncbi:MAG: 5'/3'-nucleotidase SurE [Candidatus Methanofastidiosia archaeon]